ncbi:MAG: PQQ-binding-like beta-propeller repeat protein [Candidatus Micrarchaeota archaeon]|nr:PQQ-binding-like beta-propeller repeat protein [Candidatus Micrarchaeota archaeon]
MGNMKGFIFTVDAIFSLVIAGAAVAILLYLVPYSQSIYQAPAAEATSLLLNILQSNLQQEYYSVNYATYAIDAWNGRQYQWQQFGRSQSLSSSAPIGPKSLMLSYTYNGPGATSAPVAGSGVVAFASGAYLYALNATTGKPVYNYPASCKCTSAGQPIIYGREIIYSNWTASTNYITALDISNGSRVVWKTLTSAGTGLSGPLTMAGGYVVAPGYSTFYLLNPYNGTMVSNAVIPGSLWPITQVAYSNGEYFIASTKLGSPNKLFAYGLAGGSLAQLWSNTLTSSGTTGPTVSGNIVAVGSGNTLYAFGLNGTQLWTAVTSNQIKGVASGSGEVFAETANSIYGFTNSGVPIFTYITSGNIYNATPSIGGGTLYTLINGYSYQAFNITGQKRLWMFNLSYVPSSCNYQCFNNIALAYGDAYVTNGNYLYAFGACPADPNASIAADLASLYLNKGGGCADMILNATYQSSRAAMFVNSTYAPDLKMTNFNGYNSNVNASELPGMNQLNNITVAAWVKLTSNTSALGEGILAGNSYVLRVDRQSEGSKLSWFVYVNSAIEPRLSTTKPLRLNTWYFVAATYNQKTGAMAIYVNGTLNNSETRAGTPTLGYMPNNIRIGLGDGGNYWNGTIADVQIYNTSLSALQIQQLYEGGITGAPLQTTKLRAWWPLLGDTNDYSGNNDPGITAVPANVPFGRQQYLPLSLQNSYQVGKGSIPLNIYVNGTYKFYNVSVVTWR